MSTFYQSSLRIYILKNVYKRSTFDLDFLGWKLTGQMKQKSKFGITSQRYMIHGIVLADITNFQAAFFEELKHIHRDFWKDRGDIYFQMWIVNEFEYKSTSYYKENTHIHENKNKRLLLQENFYKRYQLKPSIREHMPEATIIVDLMQTDKERTKGYSESGKRYINKGKRSELIFTIAETKEERDDYYNMRYMTGFDKGFNVLSKEEFNQLRDFCFTENKWKLFFAKKGDTIVSWSLCLIDKKQMYYLYGATDRSFGDIWGHYWLMDNIFYRWHEMWYESLDLLGISPLGYTTHHLIWVTRFKKTFGGNIISYAWNYDLVFNPLLYKGFQFLKSYQNLR